MPQADTVLTIPFDSKPTGIFQEISSSKRGIDLVDAVHTRLDEVSAMLYLLKNSEFVPNVIATVIGGIETAVEDAAALLSVCIPGDPACG